LEARINLPARPSGGIERFVRLQRDKESAIISIPGIDAGVFPQLGGEAGVQVPAANTQIEKGVGAGRFRMRAEHSRRCPRCLASDAVFLEKGDARAEFSEPQSD